MSDLTDNQFYPSAERIWSCIRLNYAGKYCDITLKMMVMLQTFSLLRQIFSETLHGNFVYSQSFVYCQKSAERKSPKKYFFVFHFVVDVWPGIRTVFSRLITQHTTSWATATFIQRQQKKLQHIFSIIETLRRNFIEKTCLEENFDRLYCFINISCWLRNISK